MKGFKVTLVEGYGNELVAVILLKAISADEAFLKVNTNYCLNSDFVIDTVEEIPIEDIKL